MLIAVFAMLMLDLLSADAVLLGGLVVVVIGGVILATAILTNIATNNGAVALMFSIALSMAKGQQLAPRALMVSITRTASMAFVTPIGYQTNLMVYGPGHYHFLDFARVGGILQVLLWIIVLVVAPLVWPM